MDYRRTDPRRGGVGEAAGPGRLSAEDRMPRFREGFDRADFLFMLSA